MSRSSSSELPIEAVLPELRETLAKHPAVVLRAEPGAGKTTRVPLALLNEAWLAGRSILLLEPRRLAAGNAARYMAALHGSPVGETVGFRVRYQSRVSPRTRIEVVTEGILTRRLQSDPELEGVGLVIFDEFHERNLQSDLGLALCREVQAVLREDLKLLIMSATLDAEPLCAFLGHAPLLDCPGREHPVHIHYLERPPATRRLDDLPGLVRRAARETAGDLLVFLPGAGEIRRLQAVLQPWAQAEGVLVAPLYGGLDYRSQELAICPSERRKLVLATNIAETSLTIEGVRTVVDSGLEKRPRFDPAAGVTRLETVRISKASARQRAGRAGRLGPGNCYRLWGLAEEGGMLPASPPEIRQADLSQLLLELACWGADPEQLAWLDPPSAASLEAAGALLRQLQALDEHGRVTSLGRRMAGFGCHPRLARLLVEALDRRQVGLGAGLVALLSEASRLVPDGEGAVERDCDLTPHLAHLRQPGAGRRWPMLVRAWNFWRQRCGEPRAELLIERREIAGLLAVAYPDRVACRRERSGDRYLLAGGQGAVLDTASRARGAEWLVAVEVLGQAGDGRIRLASSLDTEQILELPGVDADWQPEVRWDDRQGRVLAREVRRLGRLLVQQRPIKASAGQLQSALLDAIRRRGLDGLSWSPAARQLLARMRLVERVLAPPGWPRCDRAGLLDELETWLGPYLVGITSLEALAKVDLYGPLVARLDYRAQKQLEHWAPTRIGIPSGREARVDYLAGEQPVLAVKLQELFGLQQTPHLLDNRVPVLVHLLSPAGRPLQVTGDLASFWRDVYPEVRKEMAGRYPKHPWPEDPLTATATRQTKKRQR